MSNRTLMDEDLLRIEIILFWVIFSDINSEEYLAGVKWQKGTGECKNK